MKGFAFENQDFFILQNAKAKVQPRALDQRGPEFNGQQSS